MFLYPCSWMFPRLLFVTQSTSLVHARLQIVLSSQISPLSSPTGHFVVPCETFWADTVSISSLWDWGIIERSTKVPWKAFPNRAISLDKDWRLQRWAQALGITCEELGSSPQDPCCETGGRDRKMAENLMVMKNTEILSQMRWTMRTGICGYSSTSALTPRQTHSHMHSPNVWTYVYTHTHTQTELSFAFSIIPRALIFCGNEKSCYIDQSISKRSSRRFLEGSNASQISLAIDAGQDGGCLS